MMHFWTWTVILSGWAVALIMAPVLARRYAAAKAWAWLAILFALPWAGLVLYASLGENPFGRRRVARYRRVVEQARATGRFREIKEDSARRQAVERSRGIERLAEAGGAIAAVGGNRATFFVEHEDRVARLVDEVNSAERHVHMGFYIFEDDTTGRRVGEALIRAAKRGVSCRLIADSVGSLSMFGRLGKRMRRGGVDVREALPVNPLRSHFSRIDLRNHRKVAVIDGRTAYLGSWNVCDRNRDYVSYRDLFVRLSGPIVHQVQLLFLEDWSYETGAMLSDDGLFPPCDDDGDETLQALPSGPMYPSTPVLDVAVSMINQATRRVVLTTPYLVPDELLITSLRLAAGRGVTVQIIIPRRSDSMIVNAAARSYFRRLVQFGVDAYYYEKGFLHAKTLTVDDNLAMVGSANYDIRSFRLNVEANLLIYTRGMIERLLEIQEGYIAASRRIDRGELDASPWTRRTVDDLARLMSPLI